MEFYFKIVKPIQKSWIHDQDVSSKKVIHTKLYGNKSHLSFSLSDREDLIALTLSFTYVAVTLKKLLNSIHDITYYCCYD